MKDYFVELFLRLRPSLVTQPLDSTRWKRQNQPFCTLEMNTTINRTYHNVQSVNISQKSMANSHKLLRVSFFVSGNW